MNFFSRNKLRTAAFYFTELPEEMLVSGEEGYQWKINGVHLFEVKDTTRISIHYPAFDTVVLHNAKYNKTRVIITRFDPGHLYELRPLSYYYDIDMLDASEASNYKATLSQYSINDFLWDENLYGVYDSLAFFKETGTVKFRIKNQPKDSLFGAFFGDIKWGYGNGRILRKGNPTVVSDPLFLSTSGFCYYVKVGIGKEYAERDIYMEHEKLRFYTTNEKVFVFDQPLLEFEYRFFNQETLLVTYDARKRTTKLKLKS